MLKIRFSMYDNDENKNSHFFYTMQVHTKDQLINSILQSAHI
jgi:hypothetical protein